MKNILVEQNLDKNLLLLIVQRELYSKSKRFKILALIILFISIVISVFSIIPIEFLRGYPEYYFGYISTFFLVISLGIGKVSKSIQEKAAEVQQQFDCGLFNLDYQPVVDNEEIIKISDEAISKDRGIKEQVRNWYTDAIAKFNFPYSALACQQQNIGWNISLSKRYLKFLLFLLFLVIIIIVGTGFIWNEIKPLFHSDCVNFYNFLVFSVAIIKTPVSSIWSTRNEIKEKEEFIKEKHEVFSDIYANSIECIPYILKEIQSNIFRFRKNHKPIPDFFYKFYKYREEARSRQRLE